MSRCQRQSIPITIVTNELSGAARKLITDGKAQNYLAIERGAIDAQSIVYSSLSNTPVTVEKKHLESRGLPVTHHIGRRI